MVVAITIVNAIAIASHYHCYHHVIAMPITRCAGQSDHVSVRVEVEKLVTLNISHVVIAITIAITND